jgi:hypothetical protein
MVRYRSWIFVSRDASFKGTASIRYQNENSIAMIPAGWKR